MSKQRVLLLGVTGETGGSILQGLLGDPDSFDVEVLVRPSAADSPRIKELAERVVKVHAVDIASLPELVKTLVGIDVFISAIDPGSQLAQLNLATAAKEAGVKHFIPCAFTTVAPAGGIMTLRDEKEQVYQHIRKLYLPYTVIDVGYWYQLSFPALPSGRVDYASVAPRLTIHGDGNMPTMLTDLRDIGPFVALIIKDPRTLNRFVIAYGDVLSENETFHIMEDLSGEKINRVHISIEELLASRARAAAALKADPPKAGARMVASGENYKYSKYVRGDNTPEHAQYLGYLDARELYPEFKPRSFTDFVCELLAGKVPKAYASRAEEIKKFRHD
ncbi:hypothetical protein DFH07DRAFT_930752 [Mycena maculata]|uniref:NmrA-like domain-containing protein n=1 Tax=Mycena maculata TaxID=230809 RepID=A0AAD7MQI3_9AGAR|nr:hypothetical protein DFH07DRAFT_930752 [Mycena maculata]